jgi:TolB-like protein
VLAFDNMSGDPKQEYFSDGITEEIITGLSRYLISLSLLELSLSQGHSVLEVGRRLGCAMCWKAGARKDQSGSRLSS